MRLLPALLAFVLSSCAGYQPGGIKPSAMRNVKSIAVPMFKNDTLHPRAEALATSAAVDAFVLDGTYCIAALDNADAVLEAHVFKIEYSQIRASRIDSMRPEELQNTVTLNWTLKDAKNPIKVLASGSSIGTSRLFVDSNLQTARDNALPDALERATESMVSRLSNGF
jgi:hypothetical protein